MGHGWREEGESRPRDQAIRLISQDAIDYLSREIMFLREKIDAKRQAIDSLIRQERKARKGQQIANRIEGENYGESTPESAHVRLCDFQVDRRGSPHRASPSRSSKRAPRRPSGIGTDATRYCVAEHLERTCRDQIAQCVWFRLHRRHLFLLHCACTCEGRLR